MSSDYNSKPLTWKSHDEFVKGSRREWFSGKDQRKLRPWYERFCGSILKAGKVPKHVAFIMDGNRRYAKRNEVSRSAGHLAGFERLASVLEICLDMGISEVTCYAFSIENFNRSREEVDCLMDLCREKFGLLLEGRQQELLMQYGVCVRIIGDVTLLPDDLQRMLARVVVNTRNNDRAVLNVCIAYTSRNDMATAVRHCAKAVASETLLPDDVDEDVIARALMTHQSSDLELLMRTSGEIRLSDFLLWESSFCCLIFQHVLWPDFSVWDLYKAILLYQRHLTTIEEAKEDTRRRLEQDAKEEDESAALRLFRQNLPPEGADPDARPPPEVLRLFTEQCRRQRIERVETFLKTLRDERDALFERLARES